MCTVETFMHVKKKIRTKIELLRAVLIYASFCAREDYKAVAGKGS